DLADAAVRVAYDPRDPRTRRRNRWIGTRDDPRKPLTRLIEVLRHIAAVRLCDHRARGPGRVVASIVRIAARAVAIRERPVHTARAASALAVELRRVHAVAGVIFE